MILEKFGIQVDLGYSENQHETGGVLGIVILFHQEALLKYNV